jgi:hypothetical protein
MSPRVSPEPREVLPAAEPGTGASESCIPLEQETLSRRARLAGPLLERTTGSRVRTLSARLRSGGRRWPWLANGSS